MPLLSGSMIVDFPLLFAIALDRARRSTSSHDPSERVYVVSLRCLRGKASRRTPPASADVRDRVRVRARSVARFTACTRHCFVRHCSTPPSLSSRKPSIGSTARGRPARTTRSAPHGTKHVAARAPSALSRTPSRKRCGASTAIVISVTSLRRLGLVARDANAIAAEFVRRLGHVAYPWPLSVSPEVVASALRATADIARLLLTEPHGGRYHRRGRCRHGR